MPVMEADREIIAYYNKGLMEAFDRVGYFIMGGVAVCEKGKLAEVQAQMDKLSSERM